MLSAFGVCRTPNSPQKSQQNEGSTLALALALALRHATQAQAQGLTPVLAAMLVPERFSAARPKITKAYECDRRETGVGGSGVAVKHHS